LFRHYHLLLDEQADQLFAMVKPLRHSSERVGGTTCGSIGDILRQQRLEDNDQDFVRPSDTMTELRSDSAPGIARGVEHFISDIFVLASARRPRDPVTETHSRIEELLTERQKQLAKAPLERMHAGEKADGLQLREEAMAGRNRISGRSDPE
jgi:DNA-binding ferritin-like protein